MTMLIPVLCPHGEYVSETKEQWESVLECMYDEEDADRDFKFEDRIQEALKRAETPKIIDNNTNWKLMEETGQMSWTQES